jgi:hypothetical protein
LITVGTARHTNTVRAAGIACDRHVLGQGKRDANQRLGPERGEILMEVVGIDRPKQRIVGIRIVFPPCLPELVAGLDRRWR